MFPELPAGWGPGWGVGGPLEHGTGLQQLPGEEHLSCRVRERGHGIPLSAKPSVSGKPCWPGLYSFTDMKLFMASMKQPLGVGLRKECVVVKVGCRSDPRRDFPRGQWARCWGQGKAQSSSC